MCKLFVCQVLRHLLNLIAVAAAAENAGSADAAAGMPITVQFRLSLPLLLGDRQTLESHWLRLCNAPSARNKWRHSLAKNDCSSTQHAQVRLSH